MRVKKKIIRKHKNHNFTINNVMEILFQYGSIVLLWMREYNYY